MKTVLEILATDFPKQDVRVLLIGGWALQAYGVVRQTVDVDCLIAETSIDKAERILLQCGYKEKARTENFARYSHPALYLMDVDVLFVDAQTFEKMLSESRVYAMDSGDVRVPCLAHLVALKLHAIKNNPGRQVRDMGDIVEMIRANPEEFKPGELEELCRRYGPENLYSALEAVLG
jgi:hypothetical protein